MRSRSLASIALIVMCCAAFGQMRETAWANWYMDAHQTSRFMVRKDVYWYEQNPIAKGIVESRNVPAFLAFSTASAFTIDSLIQKAPKKNRDLLYALWAIAHMVAVENNRRRFGEGFPVVSFSLRF